jgi:S1-C subfamily serine protease
MSGAAVVFTLGRWSGNSESAPDVLATPVMAAPLAVPQVVVAAVVAAPTPAPAAPVEARPKSVAQVVRQTRAGVVTLIGKTASGKPSFAAGVVVNKDGLIVTNAHVVRKSRWTRVVTCDNRTLDGEVLATHPDLDLALIRVPDAVAWQPILLAANPPEVGEDVIVIGSPLGYKHTVSRGIVSALDREIELLTGVTLTGLIQTDASVNPGNSGGPLLNLDGELLGITWALRAEADGIAFVIPAQKVRGLLDDFYPASKAE